MLTIETLTLDDVVARVASERILQAMTSNLPGQAGTIVGVDDE